MDFLIESADFSLNNLAKFTQFHTPGTYPLAEQLLQMPHGLYDAFKDLLKSGFSELMNEKPAKIPDEGRSIEQWYLDHMHLFT